VVEIKMRSSLGLGIAGGIVTFILAGIEIVFGSFLQAFHVSNSGIFPTLIILSFVGGTMGIVGGAVGRVAGGIIMIIGGIFALLGAGLFGFLGLVLLVVGGGLAFREASISRQRQEAI
jgi:hypothetical protein